MKALTLLPYYFYWHYTRALKNGATIFFNLIWFLWHFFSIGLLFRSLFAPWRRIQEPVGRMWEFKEYLAAHTVNIIIRCTGALIRLTVIATGFMFMVIIMACGVIVCALWLAYPFVIVGSIIVGVVFLVKPA